jgi:CRISPR/Cas system-associated endoribonuclease Cas2
LADALRARVTRLIDPSEDRVRIYRFCADCGAKAELLGLSEPTEDREAYVL